MSISEETTTAPKAPSPAQAPGVEIWDMDPVQDGRDVSASTGRREARASLIPATSDEATVMADGTAVWLRPLRRDERDLVAGFFNGLSAQSRHRRFLRAMPRLPEPMLRRLIDVDGHSHVAVVAEAGGEIAGIARFVALPGDPDTAEVAVTVADPFQGRGIGGLLLDALRSAAERAGLGAFVYLVDPTNRPMLRLLRLREVQLRYRDGLVEGRQPLTGRRPAAA
jgi:GNAT superfamily N-acetyltransferase